MKKSAGLLSVVLLSSAYAMAQDADSLNRTQRRGTIRETVVARAAVLKSPGLPANRDYTKPVVSSSLNTNAVNPSVNRPVVQMNRNFNYASGTYNQGSYQGQITPAGAAPVTPNAFSLPSIVGPTPTVAPVNLPVVTPIVSPIVTPIVNPIVPVITPIVNPIVPIITPVTNPLTPVITPIVTPLAPITNPVVKPLLPIINPLLPGFPRK
ncbi:hypothetical protein ACXZ1K_15770 [Pedobacter sp. PWIIR3]